MPEKVQEILRRVWLEERETPVPVPVPVPNWAPRHEDVCMPVYSTAKEAKYAKTGTKYFIVRCL